MRHVALILLITILGFSLLLAQPKKVKDTQEIWNSDSGRWEIFSIHKWEFDANGREVLDLREGSFSIDSQPQSYELTSHIYDNFENLTQLEYKRSFDNDIINFKTEYVYNTLNQLIEEKWSEYHSNIGSFRLSSQVYYEYSEGGNKYSTKGYSLRPNGDLSLRSHHDYEINEKGFVVHIFNRWYDFSSDTISSIERTRMVRDASCRLLFSELEYNDFSMDKGKFIPLNRITNEYLDGGKLFISTYENNFAALGWKVTRRERKEFDNYERITKHYLASSWQGGPLDEAHSEYKYDKAGNLVLQLRYEENILGTVDSFLYVFNSQNQVSKKQWLRFYKSSEPVQNKIYYYTYYCDGQIKTIIEDNLPNVYRTTYEYDSRGECLLDKNSKNLLVYPNPSSGKFEIECKLLVGSKSVIRIFAMTGQEIYTKKIQNTTERRSIDLSGVPVGSYYLFVQNGTYSTSKRIWVW